MSNASIRMLQSATGPAVPPSGYTTLWAKTDDNFYITKDTGVTIPLSGSSGSSGVNGTSGSSGSSGVSGTSGSSGSSGVSGTSGSSGSSGNSGTSGSSGSSGDSGTSGSSGSSGVSGTSGSSGSSGDSGTSGSSGSSGVSGTSGSSGSSGDSGTSGSSGSSGDSGTSGIDGTSGISGTSGSSGSSGDSGTSGSSGSSGVSGTSGSSGSSGADGTSGVNGTSGSSGSSGISGSPSPIIELFTDTLVSTAIGATAPGGTGSIIIGRNANDNGLNGSIVIGECANNCAYPGFGNYNIVIGRCALADCTSHTGNSNIVIGHCASTCEGANGGIGRNIVIGCNARALYDGGNVAIGTDACAVSSPAFDPGRNSHAFGHGTVANGYGVLAVGNRAKSYSFYSQSIGQDAFICETSTGAISLGFFAKVDCLNEGGIAIGYESCVCCNSACSINLGKSSLVSGCNSMTIGATNCVKGNCNIVLGTCNRPTNCGNDNIIIGCCAEIVHTTCATACVSNNIVIGKGAKICTTSGGPGEDGDHIVIGTGAVSTGGTNFGSVVIGQCARTGRNRAIAIGACACSCDFAGSSVAIGPGTRVESELGIAIGYNQRASGYSINIGWEQCPSTYSVTLGGWGGGGANASEAGISIGRCACVLSSPCGIAIGAGSCVTHTGAISLGRSICTEKDCTVHVNHIISQGQGASKIHAIGTTGGASAVVDWDNGNNQTVTLNANTTFAFCNPISGANYSLVITQGGSGSYCVTWPGTVKWPSGNPPVLSTGANDIDVTSFVYIGSDYLGSANYNFG